MKQIKVIQSKPAASVKRLKVATYTRVSHNDLYRSLANQISHYSQVIQANPRWEYAGVYSDSAISGRNQKNRKDFQRMMEDCRQGNIDVILTKSISRFGRNTVELLQTIRELKNRGISVRFEKENIDTLTSEGELLLTLLASMAQEESQTISQNIRWKVKQRFQEGRPYIPQDLYGYRWNGEEYQVEPHEAAVVGQIFSWYKEGLSAVKIAKRLDNRGERTRLGNRFTKRIIYNILNQEAYCGRLVLQKTFRDGFENRSILNNGQMTKYIVENAHEPIVTPELFMKLQQERKKRNKRRVSKHEGLGYLKGKVYCEHCGLDMLYAVEKKFNGDKRVRYYCRTRDYKGTSVCPGRTLTEEKLLEELKQFYNPFHLKEILRVDFNSLTRQARVQLLNGRSLTVTVKKGR